MMQYIMLIIGLLCVCVRVNERMILIDAIKDLLTHVNSGAERTVINDFIEYVTSPHVRQSSKAAAGTASADDASFTADDETVPNSSEKSLTSGDEIFKDVVTEGIQRAQEIDTVKDDERTEIDTVKEAGEVEAREMDASKAAGDGMSHDRQWKLFIKAHSRIKNMPHRSLMLSFTCHTLH